MPVHRFWRPPLRSHTLITGRPGRLRPRRRGRKKTWRRSDVLLVSGAALAICVGTVLADLS